MYNPSSIIEYTKYWTSNVGHYKKIPVRLGTVWETSQAALFVLLQQQRIELNTNEIEKVVTEGMPQEGIKGNLLGTRTS